MDSRKKGHVFEREVARQILAAAGVDYTKKDCYRTPLSGGHPYADTGDLVISARLHRNFPFTVECKQYGKWRVGDLLLGGKREAGWMRQACTAARRSRRPSTPLLIMRGNFRAAWCAGPRRVLREYLQTITAPYAVIRGHGERWLVVPWSRLLARLSSAAKASE